MQHTTINDLASILDDSTVRTVDELRCAVQAAGLRYDEVTAEWIEERTPWLQGFEAQPFPAGSLGNAIYERLAGARGIGSVE